MTPLVWLILAGLLLAGEFIVPGLVVVWFGAGAVVVALVTWIFGLGLAVQLVLFAAVSLGLLFGLRKPIKQALIGDGPQDDAGFNDRRSGMAGMTTVLRDPIENGRGSAFFGDTRWNVEGPDLPAGTKVRIVGLGADGRLRVEAA